MNISYRAFAAAVSIFAAVVFTNSCASKDADAAFPEGEAGKLVVTGAVYDENSNQGIEGLTVELKTFKAEDSNYSYPLESVGTISDEEGRFSLSTELLTGSRYALIVTGTNEQAGGSYQLPYQVPLGDLNYSGQGYDSSSNTYNVNCDIPISSVSPEN